MNRSRKAALTAAAVVALGLGGVGVAHSQVTPKPTAKPKATAKPAATPKTPASVKPATAAKPVVASPHHTG
jgi:hypothetical protein